jgi:hypothetical protein
VTDLLMIAATLGFFAVCVAYVALCDRIVGHDEPEPPREPGDQPESAPADREVVR